MSTDLQQTFYQAAELFNAGEYDKLCALFDIDAIMKRVDDPGSIVGIGNLLAYLNTHQKPLQPQLEDVKIVFQKGNDGTQGIVIGTARYRDAKQDQRTIPVQFSFVFTRDDKDSDWLLINAFAVPAE